LLASLSPCVPPCFPPGLTLSLTQHALRSFVCVIAVVLQTMPLFHVAELLMIASSPQCMRGCCCLSPFPVCCRHVTTTCMALSQMPSVTQQCKPLAFSCSTLLVVSAPGQSLCDMFSHSLEHVAGQRSMFLKTLYVPTGLLHRSMLPLLYSVNAAPLTGH
jgi:hypothetical protein